MSVTISSTSLARNPASDLVMHILPLLFPQVCTAEDHKVYIGTEQNRADFDPSLLAVLIMGCTCIQTLEWNGVFSFFLLN